MSNAKQKNTKKSTKPNAKKGAKDTAETVLKLENITRQFQQGSNIIDVLNGAALEIKAGEMVALVGPSGSGKSTLLQIAGLLEPPDTGKVTIGTYSLENYSDHTRTLLRRDHVGFIYQFHHLLSDFTALENLVLPQLIAQTSRHAATEKAYRYLDQMQLLERAHHFPAELSGGEQQRVAIVRALMNDPALLLADEPTGNLDQNTANIVFDFLLDSARQAGLGTLIATHDMNLADKMDRVLTIKDGKITSF